MRYGSAAMAIARMKYAESVDRLRKYAPTIVGSARPAKNLERVPSAMESFVPIVL
jgi:hypothetical protein